MARKKKSDKRLQQGDSLAKQMSSRAEDVSSSDSESSGSTSSHNARGASEVTHDDRRSGITDVGFNTERSAEAQSPSVVDVSQELLDAKVEQAVEKMFEAVMRFSSRSDAEQPRMLRRLFDLEQQKQRTEFQNPKETTVRAQAAEQPVFSELQAQRCDALIPGIIRKVDQDTFDAIVNAHELIGPKASAGTYTQDVQHNGELAELEKAGKNLRKEVFEGIQNLPRGYDSSGVNEVLSTIFKDTFAFSWNHATSGDYLSAMREMGVHNTIGFPPGTQGKVPNGTQSGILGMEAYSDFLFTRPNDFVPEKKHLTSITLVTSDPFDKEQYDLMVAITVDTVQDFVKGRHKIDPHLHGKMKVLARLNKFVVEMCSYAADAMTKSNPKMASVKNRLSVMLAQPGPCTNPNIVPHLQLRVFHELGIDVSCGRAAYDLLFNEIASDPLKFAKEIHSFYDKVSCFDPDMPLPLYLQDINHKTAQVRLNSDNNIAFADENIMKFVMANLEMYPPKNPADAVEVSKMLAEHRAKTFKNVGELLDRVQYAGPSLFRGTAGWKVNRNAHLSFSQPLLQVETKKSKDSKKPDDPAFAYAAAAEFVAAGQGGKQSDERTRRRHEDHKYEGRESSRHNLVKQRQPTSEHKEHSHHDHKMQQRSKSEHKSHNSAKERTHWQRQSASEKMYAPEEKCANWRELTDIVMDVTKKRGVKLATEYCANGYIQGGKPLLRFGRMHREELDAELAKLPEHFRGIVYKFIRLSRDNEVICNATKLETPVKSFQVKSRKLFQKQPGSESSGYDLDVSSASSTDFKTTKIGSSHDDSRGHRASRKSDPRKVQFSDKEDLSDISDDSGKKIKHHRRQHSRTADYIDDGDVDIQFGIYDDSDEEPRAASVLKSSGSHHKLSSSSSSRHDHSSGRSSSSSSRGSSRSNSSSSRSSSRSDSGGSGGGGSSGGGRNCM